ncbi:MAG: tetratricopeptide repeat protein [Prolixibacteraceae bacterium]
MKKVKYALFIVFVLSGLSLHAQNERKFIRQGNKIYEQALADTTKLDTTAFSQAEVAYRKALEKRPDDLKWNFNLGDALYKQMNLEQAAGKFEEIAQKSTDNVEKSRALHNLGNSLLLQNKVDESIEAYKNALRQNPQDPETKYNLLYAMNLKKKQEQQKQNQKQDQNQNKDQQDKKDQNKDQDQDKNKDQQNKNQEQNKDQQDQKQNQNQQTQKISKENAERLLQALQNDEQKIQEKVKKAKAERAQERKTEKDW